MEEIKHLIGRGIDTRRKELLQWADELWKNPEIGYREFKTAAMVKKVFSTLGLPVEDRLAVTGCRAVLDTGKPGRTIALLGEMDALYLPGHPEADRETGAVHACGHHLQIVSLLGAAVALTQKNVQNKLNGKIVFIAVPAEEFGMDEDRVKLKREGAISFFGGKQEMIAQGVFDGIEAAVMVHAADAYHYPSSYNGFIAKRITFKGRAAHAGLTPHAGINALYAANIALNAINAQRETFQDEDHVRVHGIIVNGGDVINIIPDTVSMEVQVRAATIEAIRDAATKVDRSVRAGAMAMGAAVEIETIPGYMPLRNNRPIADIYGRNLSRINPGNTLSPTGHRPSSTDMGDLSCIMPILHANSRGVEGKFHSCDFNVVNLEQACVEPAKLMAMTAVDLLNAPEIPAGYELMSKKEYLAAIKSFADTRQYQFQD